jgi:hypothetical protein
LESDNLAHPGRWARGTSIAPRKRGPSLSGIGGILGFYNPGEGAFQVCLYKPVRVLCSYSPNRQRSFDPRRYASGGNAAPIYSIGEPTDTPVARRRLIPVLYIAVMPKTENPPQHSYEGSIQGDRLIRPDLGLFNCGEGIILMA